MGTEGCPCHTGPLKRSHRCQPRVFPVLQQGSVQGRRVQLRKLGPRRSRRWVRGRRGLRLRLLAGEEQLEREVGPRRVRQDREERGRHVRRCFLRQLSSCLKQLASLPVYTKSSSNTLSMDVIVW